MTEQRASNRKALQAALERATREARELMERLRADLNEQTRRGEIRFVEAPCRIPHDE